LNRGWRFCRPLPYHLATAPVGIANCAGIFRPRLAAATTTTVGGAGVIHRRLGESWGLARAILNSTQRCRVRSPPSATPARGAEWAYATPRSGARRRAHRARRYQYWSGKRDSNPRLRPWQGRTLPLSYSRLPEAVIVPHRTRRVSCTGAAYTASKAPGMTVTCGSVEAPRSMATTSNRQGRSSRRLRAT
jgi:hypothetical protein